jgi:hypothetical protein
MPAEISIGVVCRDASLLPSDEVEFRSFFEGFLAPAIYQDFRKNFLMGTGQGFDGTRAYDAEVMEKGCEVGGSVTIRF